MLQSLGDNLSRLARRYVPDPFILAVFLTLISLAAALIYLDFDVARVLGIWMDGKGGGRGFWLLLAFGMQMCLILVTGQALAESPPVSKALGALADRARSPKSSVVVVALGAMILGLINWGLGLIAGALLARRVGQRARQRGIDIHYPLVVAAGYTGLLVWHGGLSGSAPLKVTRLSDIKEILGAETAAEIGGIPLDQTIGSLGNVLVNLALLVLVPWILASMLPSDVGSRVSAPELSFDEEEQGGAAPAEETTPAEKLERSIIVVLAIALPALAAWGMKIYQHGAGRLNLNLVNFLFLFAGLMMHGSVRSYLKSVSDGARGCAGIIIQFPFYAGIMGILSGSGLLESMALLVARAGKLLLIALGFYLAGLVNLFVPSGGGQWAVQGPLLVKAGLKVGLPPAKMVLTLAYGDQWTNMLQPFWALPLLAITKVSARDIVGYTTVILLASQAVFLIGLYLPNF